MKNTLGDVLKGCSVIEFPRFEDVLMKDLEYFPVLIEEVARKPTNVIL
jgi:hypothetical protein